jgi:hypothetical protein
VEGFRQNPKMKSQIACFKEGGSTTPAKREEKKHAKADVAEDKKMVKKAVAQHEGAKHKGEEKTELKLKDGGRAKKDKPSVKRFDSKAIKMKKDASDKKAIAKVKKTKPVVERMSPAPAAPAPEGMGMPMESTDDMGLQGFADGSQVGGMSNVENQMDADMAAFRSRSGANKPAPTTKRSELNPVDRYELEKRMGRFSGSFKDYLDSKPQGFADGSQVPQMDPGMSAYMPQEMVRRGGNRMPMGRMNPNVMNPRNMPPMPPGQMQDIRSMGRPMGAGAMGAGMPGAGAMGAGMPGAGAMGGMSDQERAILQGLQAVGAYCAGGKA